MKFFENPGLYMLVLLLGFWVMFFSIWDVLFNKGWGLIIGIGYLLLIVFCFLIIYIRYYTNFTKTEEVIEEFEKTLEGGLFHYKCPTCEGLFAIKKSRRNDKKPVKMTCPDCGMVGIIPTYGKTVEEEIPEKKSVGVNFKCNSCGEGVTIWAEGSELYSNICMYSCPYCGEQQTMNRI